MIHIIIYFLTDALIQGDLQLLQYITLYIISHYTDITLFLHTITHYSVGFLLEQSR